MKRTKSIFELGVVSEVASTNIQHSARFKSGPKFWKKKRKHKLMKENRTLKSPNVPKDYKKYIKSKYWRKRKIEYYKTHVRECVACKSKSNLNLHHVSYTNVGNELDIDLIVLCEVCHENYHLKNGVHRNSFDRTQQFIIEEQEANELKDIVDRF